MAERLVVGATPRELEVARLLASGLPRSQVAVALQVQRATVSAHVRQLAARIPGDLPAEARVIVWFRGGSREVLG